MICSSCDQSPSYDLGPRGHHSPAGYPALPSSQLRHLTGDTGDWQRASRGRRPLDLQGVRCEIPSRRSIGRGQMLKQEMPRKCRGNWKSWFDTMQKPVFEGQLDKKCKRCSLPLWFDSPRLVSKFSFHAMPQDIPTRKFWFADCWILRKADMNTIQKRYTLYLYYILYIYIYLYVCVTSKQQARATRVQFQKHRRCQPMQPLSRCPRLRVVKESGFRMRVAI